MAAINDVVCVNCKYPFKAHVKDISDRFLCIGVTNVFTAPVADVTATVMYYNEQGVAESRDGIVIMAQSKSVARLDNLITGFLARGYSKISINIDNK